MFRKQRQFNIITGQIGSNPITQRSLSCATQVLNFTKIKPYDFKPSRLGVPKDQKQFKYSYIESSLSPLKATLSNPNVLKKTQSLSNQTMMNYVSTNYNIISHSQQIYTAKVANKATFSHKMPEVYKKSPLTEHFHRARPFAPNYHQDYDLKTSNHEFNKKTGYCAGICNIQKTYGQSKFFRKLK